MGTSKTITYDYNGVGLVSYMAISGETGNFSYTYNGNNQLSSVTNPNSVEVDFSYDNGGRRTRITDPGSYVQYDYNARNWITDVTIARPAARPATSNYTYNDGSPWDNHGNPVKRTEDIAGSTYTTTLRMTTCTAKPRKPRRTVATTPSTTLPTAMTRAETELLASSGEALATGPTTTTTSSARSGLRQRKQRSGYLHLRPQRQYAYQAYRAACSAPRP